MAFASETHIANHGLKSFFARLTTDLKERLQRRRAFNATYAELASLHDRELADLGLHRSMIRSVALEAVYDSQPE